MVTDHSRKPDPARPAQRAAADKPNVILIVVDTLRADAAEWMRRQDGPSGHRRSSRTDGVVFDRAYSQASWTRPSIATILTAQYPSVHGTVHKMDFLPDSRAHPRRGAEGAQGYWTAAFTTNINVAPIFNFQQGFDEFHYLEPSFYFGATDSATQARHLQGAARRTREGVERDVGGQLLPGRGGRGP